MPTDGAAQMQTSSESSANSSAGPTLQQRMVLVDDRSMKTVNARPSLRAYVGKLWQQRFLIKADAKARSLSTGRETFLGRLWILLDPILQVSIYALIFGLVLPTSRGMDNFIGFLTLGVIFFKVLSKGLTSGALLIQRSRGLISSFSFPRATVVFSATLRNAIDDLMPVFLGVLSALLFQLEKPVSLTVLAVIPLYLLAHVFTSGMTLIVARLTAFIPDVKNLVNVAVRGLFFLSGIFFSLERFDSNPLVQEIMRLNPFYQYLYAVRTCVLDGQLPSLFTTCYLFAWSFGMFLIGFVFFWRAEARYAHVR